MESRNKSQVDGCHRSIQPQPQNWLARFLHIKPASKILCFQVTKQRARREIVSILREWRRYGIRDVVVDKVRGRVWSRVDEKNCMTSRIHLLLLSFKIPRLVTRNANARNPTQSLTSSPSLSPPSFLQSLSVAEEPNFPSRDSRKKRALRHRSIKSSTQSRRC